MFISTGFIFALQKHNHEMDYLYIHYGLVVSCMFSIVSCWPYLPDIAMAVGQSFASVGSIFCPSLRLVCFLVVIYFQVFPSLHVHSLIPQSLYKRLFWLRGHIFKMVLIFPFELILLSLFFYITFASVSALF